MAEPARIARGARFQEGEFRGHGLAEQHAAAAPRLAHHRRVGGGTVAGKDRGIIFGGQFSRIENVLHRERQPGERAIGLARRLRGCAGGIEIKDGERAHVFLMLVDRLRAQVHKVEGREAAGSHIVGKVAGE
jgi:hypothetical protein